MRRDNMLKAYMNPSNDEWNGQYFTYEGNTLIYNELDDEELSVCASAFYSKYWNRNEPDSYDNVLEQFYIMYDTFFNQTIRTNRFCDVLVSYWQYLKDMNLDSLEPIDPPKPINRSNTYKIDILD